MVACMGRQLRERDTNLTSIATLVKSFANMRVLMMVMMRMTANRLSLLHTIRPVNNKQGIYRNHENHKKHRITDSHRLPTSYEVKMELTSDSYCYYCHSQDETITHLFWTCDKIQLFLNELLQWLKKHNIQCEITEEFFYFWRKNYQPKKKKKYIYIYTTQGKSTGLVPKNKNRTPPPPPKKTNGKKKQQQHKITRIQL